MLSLFIKTAKFALNKNNYYEKLFFCSSALLISCSSNDQELLISHKESKNTLSQTNSVNNLVDLTFPVELSAPANYQGSTDLYEYHIIYSDDSITFDSAYLAIIVDSTDRWVTASLESHFLVDHQISNNFLTNPPSSDSLIIAAPMLLRNCKKRCGCEVAKCDGPDDDKECWNNCKEEGLRNTQKHIYGAFAVAIGLLASLQVATL